MVTQLCLLLEACDLPLSPLATYRRTPASEPPILKVHKSIIEYLKKQWGVARCADTRPYIWVRFFLLISHINHVLQLKSEDIHISDHDWFWWFLDCHQTTDSREGCNSTGAQPVWQKNTSEIADSLEKVVPMTCLHHHFPLLMRCLQYEYPCLSSLLRLRSLQGCKLWEAPCTCYCLFYRLSN